MLSRRFTILSAFAWSLIALCFGSGYAQQSVSAVLNLYYSNDLIGYLTPCG